MKLMQITKASEQGDDMYMITITGGAADVLQVLGTCGFMSTGPTLTVVKPAAETKPATTEAAKPAEKPAVTKPTPAAKKTAPAQEAAAPKAEAKPAEKPAEKPKAAAAPVMDLDLPDDEDDHMPGEEDAAADDDKPFSLEGALPEELVTAGRLKQIVVFLQERGFHTDDAIIAACEKIKDRVPVLSRLPVVADRVKVALEVLRQG